MNLIMFTYNFMRTKNILGFEKMLKSIERWQPNYSKIVCALKTAIMRRINSQNKEGTPNEYSKLALQQVA